MEAWTRAQAVSDDWAEHLGRLIAESSVNLVSRRDRSDVRRIHVDECLLLAERLHPRPGERWMDLGTGGGLPGLVLAAAFPRTQWTLVDARAKKVDRVRQFAESLALANVQAVHGRAEDLATAADHVGAYGGVISRATGSLQQTAILARAFVTTGAVLAVRGPRATDDVAESGRLLADLGLLVDAVEQIDGTIRPTWLVRLRGQGPVPADFPRLQRALLRATRGGSQ